MRKRKYIKSIIAILIIAGMLAAAFCIFKINSYKQVTEEELLQRLEAEISGEIIETFYGDFNDDGKYELWAQVWDKDGVSYESIFDGIDELYTRCEANEYGLETGKDYKQLQIWYVDAKEAELVDSYQSIRLTEEFVNGTSSYWGEDTFYYLAGLKANMLEVGKTQQLCVCVEHTWMTGRGWGIDIDRSVALYENEDGPDILFKDNDSDIDYELCGDDICVVRSSDYNIVSDEEFDTDLHYPVDYTDGKFIERASIEVDESDLKSLQGYKEIYAAAVSEEIAFESFEAGEAANVYYTFRVDNIEPSQYLYNDYGYIFINGKASGVLYEWVSALGEEIEHPDSQIDICLELHVEDAAITGYRWLGAHQQMAGTDFERISSEGL